MIADAKDREKAVRTLDRNVSVEAGAGTGKTTLLIDRLSVLLLRALLPVDRVVALTFTEKAASEIRERLAKRLHDVLDGKRFDALDGAGTSEQLAERAAAALAGLDRAPIGTIHSFASRLLRLYPLEAGVDPSFEVDEGPESDELFDAEWGRWLDRELAEDAPRAEAWLGLLETFELEELAELARVLCSPKFDRLPPSAGAAPGLAALAEEAELLAESYPPPKGKLRKIELALAASSARLRDLVLCLEKPGASPLSVPELDPEVGSKPPAGWTEEAFQRARVIIQAAASTGRESESRLASALELLSPFVDGYRRAYDRRGFVTFDGLLVKARDLARDHAAVREELKGTFDAFLIDEFQDTDPLQGELLAYLAERPGTSERDWRKVKLAPGKLFVVGDPKQSIYRFRGADISAFEAFTKLLVSQGAVECRLSVNFRSRPALIDGANAVFGRIMDAVPGSQAGYAPLAAGRGEEGGAPSRIELLRHQGPGGAEDLRAAEAEAIADWIVAKQAEGVALKDVAILLRSFSPVRTYIDALRRRGLPYVVDGERTFYSAPEVLDFFNLLHAIDDPSNKVALLGVLRSPFGGLSDAEILALASKGPLDYRRPVEGPAAALFARLSELNKQVGARPVGELVAAALTAPYFIEASALAFQGEQTAANLAKFGRLAAEASDERGLSLKEFIRRLQTWLDRLREEGESPLADESVDAVRLLSVHKSKGLEFPVVVLPNLCGGRSRGEKERSRSDWRTGLVGLRLGGEASAAMALLEANEPARQADEELRVFYVAMTRAKERLVLLASGDAKRGSCAEMLERAGALGGLKGWTFTELGAKDEAARAASAPPDRPLALDVDALVRAAASRVKAAAAAEAPLFVAPSAKRATVEEDGLERPMRAGEKGILVGLAAHLALARVDWARPAPDAVAAARELALRSPDAGWDGAGEEAQELLARFAKSPASAQLRGARILARELPFCYAEGGQVVRGAIDLVCRIDGRLTVVDFKTDQVTEKEARKRAETYRAQGDAYVEAVRRALGEEASFRLVFVRAGTSVELELSTGRGAS